MRIIYPYPMKLSIGYTYMLSILQFLNALADFYEVEILCLDSQEEIDEYFISVLGLERNKNLNVTTISNRWCYIKSNKYFFFWRVKKLISESFRDEKIIIYSRDFKQMKLLLQEFNKSKNIQFFFEVHQILSENLRKKGQIKNSKRMREMENFVFQHVDHLVSITSTLRDEILNKFCQINNSSLVLPVGFSQDFLGQNNLKKDIDVIYTGNFSEWKGIDILLKSIHLIKFQYKLKLNVVLIGARKKEMEFYSSLSRDLDLSRDITIMGRLKHKKILSFLQRSRIGAITNKYLDDGEKYTSPLKLYEYLGVGLKVVASALPSIKSNIPDDIVYFFEPENADELALEIISALNDQDFNREKVQKFASNFTWKSRAEKLKVYIDENISYQI